MAGPRSSLVFFCHLTKVLLVLGLTNCGRGVQPKPAISQPSTTPVTSIFSCSVPVTGSLTRLSPLAGVDITTASTVQWQLTLSGGCSAQYSIDGGRTLITSPYLFQKSYAQVGRTRESVSAIAVYANSEGGGLAQTISSDPFDVVAPPPLAPLSCVVTAPQPQITVPVDENGTVLAPLPVVPFSIQVNRGTTPAPARITAFQSLNVPALPVALPTGTQLSSTDSTNGAPILLPLVFSKAGTQVVGLSIASGTAPVQTGSCLIVYNVVGVVQAPPMVRSFTSSFPTVTAGGSTVLSWISTGTVTGCRISGSIRGYSAAVPANGSLEVVGINAAELFRLECKEVSSNPITVAVVPRPNNTTLDFNAGSGFNNPNDLSKMLGQTVPPIPFLDLGRPAGDNYGQFFYPGVETTDFVSRELGIDPNRCPQTKIAEGAPVLTVNAIPFSRTYVNGNPNLPLGDVGVYAWGHGGAAPMVSVQTNFRTVSLKSTYQRGAGNQSPFIFTNGFKIVLGIRSFYNINSFAAAIGMVPGEVVLNFSTTVNVFDNASLGGGLWKATCR